MGATENTSRMREVVVVASSILPADRDSRRESLVLEEDDLLERERLTSDDVNNGKPIPRSSAAPSARRRCFLIHSVEGLSRQHNEKEDPGSLLLIALPGGGTEQYCVSSWVG
jgi:hypothetical protein